MVILIARKSIIATLQLLLRANPNFMITSVLLVLFLVFNAHTHVNPFMSPADFSKAVFTYKQKLNHVVDDGKDQDGDVRGREDVMLRSVAQTLEIEENEEVIARKRLAGKSSRDFERLQPNKVDGLGYYTHNYNITERILLSASILICILNLLYVGAVGDEARGQDMSVARTVLALLIATTLVLATVYYGAVFVSELTGSKHKFEGSQDASLVRITGLDLTWNPMQYTTVEMTKNEDTTEGDAISPAEVQDYVQQMRDLRSVNTKQQQQLKQTRNQKISRKKRQQKDLRPRALTGHMLET